MSVPLSQGNGVHEDVDDRSASERSSSSEDEEGSSREEGGEDGEDGGGYTAPALPVKHQLRDQRQAARPEKDIKEASKAAAVNDMTLQSKTLRGEGRGAPPYYTAVTHLYR
ncbi:hypothetical protein N2152v2_004549 [Parachlorella kessleri]